MGKSRRSERLKVIVQVSNWATRKTKIGRSAKVDGPKGENWIFQKLETERSFGMKVKSPKDRNWTVFRDGSGQFKEYTIIFI